VKQLAIISEKDAEKIRSLFATEVTEPVKIEFFTQKEDLPGCEYCKETGGLLAELAALSPQIELVIHDETTEPVPSFELKGRNKGRVRFFGFPGGYEFGTLIEDIVDVAKGVTKLSATTKARLAELTQPVHLQVFTTPT
jgi:alkyl hydroperoxide reductase subunit AhpF